MMISKRIKRSNSLQILFIYASYLFSIYIHALWLQIRLHIHMYINVPYVRSIFIVIIVTELLISLSLIGLINYISDIWKPKHIIFNFFIRKGKNRIFYKL